jgi:hypothetical protein
VVQVAAAGAKDLRVPLGGGVIDDDDVQRSCPPGQAGGGCHHQIRNGLYGAPSRHLRVSWRASR